MPTVLAHPAVARYLAELDQALRGSSAHHADELRDQVCEHLNEALTADGTDATDAQIEDTLARLGPPHRLFAGEDEPPETLIYTRPSLTGWLVQRPKNWWATLAALAVLLIAGTVTVTVENNVAPMQAGCWPCAFAFPQDRLHMIDPPAFDQGHMIAIQRFGQDQAITFALYNPSRYTQVVSGGQIGLPPSETGDPMSLDIATISQGRRDLSREWPHHFVTHDVAIAPHAYQQVVLHWVQNVCSEHNDTATIDGVDLQVRTLGVTRHETVTIGQQFTILGAGGKATCKNGAVAHGRFRTSM